MYKPRFTYIFLLSFLMVLAFNIISCERKSTPSTSAHSNPAVRTATYRERVIPLTNLNVDIINAVNNYRKSRGLGALHILSIASVEATKHSQAMASKRVSFGHTGFNQRAIVLANELNGSSATGENVAYGKMTASEVLQAWLKSAAHRANIEGRFDYTGVGVAKDTKGVLYYTQLFVKK